MVTAAEQAKANAIKVAEWLVRTWKEGHDDLVWVAERNGLKKLGSGYYSKVFEHPSAPGLVIKFCCSDEDEASITYLAWARAHPGPHVPVIHHLLRGSGYHVSVMNKLYPLDGNNMVEYDKYMSYYSDYGRHADVFGPARVALEIKEFFSDIAGWDLHNENVMQDANGVMVITDPITKSTNKQSRALRTGIERAYGVKEAA